MRHLEDACARRRQVREDGALDSRADVAGEQDRDVAEHNFHYHRIVVTYARSLPIGRLRMQHTQRRLAEREALAGEPLSDRNPATARGSEPLLQRRTR